MQAPYGVMYGTIVEQLRQVERTGKRFEIRVWVYDWRADREDVRTALDQLELRADVEGPAGVGRSG